MSNGKLEKDKLIELLQTEIINNPIESNAPTYQPIYFNEFKHINTSLMKDGFYEKFELIFKYVDTDLSNKKVLDIGSNAGFFSFAAAERKAEVDAFEPNIKYVDLCLKISKIYGISNINFINNYVTVDFLTNKKYDYGFFLSVFQWMCEGNDKLELGKRTLFEVSKHVSTLFFELGCNHGHSAIKTSKINHIAYIYYLLRENTVYKNIYLMGSTKFWAHYHRYIFICSDEDIKIKEPILSFLKWINV